jgi:hypothetical protein
MRIKSLASCGAVLDHELLILFVEDEPLIAPDLVPYLVEHFIEGIVMSEHTTNLSWCHFWIVAC